MHTVYLDSNVSDQVRRSRIFEGQIFLFSPRASIRALAEHARSMIEGAFPGKDPRYVQFDMPVEDYVAVVAPLKPQFIHNDETKRLVRDVLADMGCDLETTYQDVPRLRMVTSDAYLTSGVGYAHHLHRDAWYSAPLAQLNWWLPIYDIESECSMAFHPRYWSEGVPNGSADFNYYEWNATGRKDAANQIKADTRKQPKPPEDFDPDPQVRFVVPPGGLVLFSGAQMHSTVPNTSGFTRYSIDFRTVNIEDLESASGAPNVDSHCTGTSLRDFKRSSDLADLPEDLVGRYDTGARPAEGVLVFSPKG